MVPILTLMLAFVLAFAITYWVMPLIIRLSRTRGLMAESIRRSSHQNPTPVLGGVGIFIGFLLSRLLVMPPSDFANMQHILAGVIIVFFIGFKDDVAEIVATKKLLALLVAVFVIVVIADVRLKSCYDLFSWSKQLPYWGSVLLSAFTVLVVINAFNLIDGINGLCGGLGILVFSVLGAWFCAINQLGHATLAFAGAGALLAFLRFNLSKPSQIFMGDSGSLMVGAMAVILVIEFLTLNGGLAHSSPWKMQASPVIAVTLLGIPLLDTLRVFIIRARLGISPFTPDRRHLHHMLIDLDLSHRQATFSLVSFNAIAIVFVGLLHDQVEQHILLAIVLGSSVMGAYLLQKQLRKKQANDSTSAEQKVAHSNKLEVPIS